MGEVRGGGDVNVALGELERRFSGELAVAAINLATGETVEHRADRVMPTASVIKLAILCEVWRQAAEGRLDLGQRVVIGPGDAVLGSGVLRDFAPGLAPTVRDLGTLMVIVSDNTATNLLIDLVGGVGPVNANARRLGLPDTTLHRRIDFGQIGRVASRFGESTPRDLARLTAMLARGEVVDARASAEMVEIMRRQQYLDQVPRYLNSNPHADALEEGQEAWAACKTGMMPGTRADAGILHLPGGVEIAYAAMTDGGSDQSFAADNEGEVVNGIVGRLLGEHWWPGGPMPAWALLPGDVYGRLVG